MQGVVIINAYPNGEKFIRQGERIAQELRLLGVETDVLRNGEIGVCIDESGRAQVNMPKAYDFAVYLDKDKYLGKLLESKGLRLFNSASAVENCDDKMLTYLALLNQNVCVAKSIPAPLCYTRDAKVEEKFLSYVAETLGFPLVAKKSFGSFGMGVRLIHGMPELRECAQNFLYEPHFFQQYVQTSKGRDVRVIVIGGKAIAAMERRAQEGEFRSNIELGGEGHKIELSSAQRQTAEKAAQALGLDYCGVDILYGEQPIVCEVNSNAFFEGLEQTTGCNVAASYADYILKTMQKR